VFLGGEWFRPQAVSLSASDKKSGRNIRACESQDRTRETWGALTPFQVDVRFRNIVSGLRN